ncbi:MAG: ethanolamine utilization protein EutJ [Synergistales bacterium]|nr:ethanolamine utilization protein EutJ [Synergistales bacterium]
MSASLWLTPALEACARALESPRATGTWEKLYLGFDLGTTNLVVVAVSEAGVPVAAVLEPSFSAVRDGVVVDYWAAVQGMKKALERLCRKLGDGALKAVGAAAYPPGISPKTAKVCANVVESLGFDCLGLYEEPAAAAVALGMTKGAIIDIGGGTTGVAVIEEGRVLYSADEPTGGVHMTLVLAGSRGLSFEEAERLKRDRGEQKRLVPTLQPVLEKMATLARGHLARSGYLGRIPLVLVGGGADLPGSEEILSSVVGCPVALAPEPLLVTPLGIALNLWRDNHGDG